MLKPGNLKNNTEVAKLVEYSVHAKRILESGLMEKEEINMLMDSFVQDHKAVRLLLGDKLYMHYKKKGFLDPVKHLETDISFDEFCLQNSGEAKKREKQLLKFLHTKKLEEFKQKKSEKQIVKQNTESYMQSLDVELHSYFDRDKLPRIKDIAQELNSIKNNLNNISQGQNKVKDSDFILDYLVSVKHEEKIKTQISALLIADLLVNGTATEKNKFKKYRKQKSRKSDNTIDNSILDYYKTQGMDSQFGPVKQVLNLKIGKLVTTVRSKQNKLSSKELEETFNATIDKKSLQKQAQQELQAELKLEYKKIITEGSESFYAETEKTHMQNFKNNFLDKIENITIPYNLAKNIKLDTDIKDGKISIKNGILTINKDENVSMNNKTNDFENKMKDKTFGPIRAFLFDKVIEYLQIEYLKQQLKKEGIVDFYIFKTEARDDTFDGSDAIYYNSKTNNVASIDFGIMDKNDSKIDKALTKKKQLLSTAFILKTFLKDNKAIDILDIERFAFLKEPEEIYPILVDLLKGAFKKTDMSEKEVNRIIRGYNDITKVTKDKTKRIIDALRVVAKRAA